MEKRVLLAYSGGLDTTYVTAKLASEGWQVCALTVDCGGFDVPTLEAMRQRALAAGAVEHRVIDARSMLFDRVLRWMIAGNVRRGGTYPLSVAAERGLQAEILAQVAAHESFEAMAHGCTGAGNDQVRFEAALAVVGEGIPVLAPVRDLAPSRDEERAYLESRNLPMQPSGSHYSVNAGLWGLTIGGGAMHTSDEPLPEDAWQWTRDAQGEASLEVAFELGVPYALDGEELDPVELIQHLNVEAGKIGVGRGYHLGDTVLGNKGRIGFEAPAAEVLLSAHRELEKLVLTEDQRFWKDHLGDVYGRRLHQGLLHDPLMRDIEAFLASSQRMVTGSVHLRLARGSVLVEGVSSPLSMLAASDALYGERPASNSDPAGIAHLARVIAEPARLSRRAAQGGSMARTK